MKLEYDIAHEVLQASGPCEKVYKVHRAGDGWVAERWRGLMAKKLVELERAERECGWSKIPTLQEALHVCDQDAGVLEAISCSAYVKEMDAAREKAPRSFLEIGAPERDSPKFPSTMDAEVWSSRATAWFGAFKVPDLTEWFQAALSHGFREGQASVYELVDRAQRQRDLYGPVVPGTQAPEPPSVEDRLADLERRANVDWSMPGNIVRNDSLITFSKLSNVKLAAAKRFEELEKRLGDLEEQTAFNDRNLDRADAAFVELRKELTQFVAAKVQAVERRVFNLENPDGDTRWHGVQKRLSDLEAWLGTKKLAPERNFAFETWSRIGKIEARLKTLEPDVPACEE